LKLGNITTGNTYWAFAHANNMVAGNVGHLWNHDSDT
jgi:hypothetical protein